MAFPLALRFGLMVICLLLIGGMAAYLTSQFAARVSHLGAQNTRGTVHLAMVEDAVRRLCEGPSPSPDDPDSRERQAMQRDTDWCLAQIDQNIRFLAASARSRQEAALLADFSRHYRYYLDARPRWLELSGTSRTEEATLWRGRTLLPAGKGMEQALQELGRMRQRSSDAVERQAMAEARSLRFILIGGLVIALAVGVIAAVAISRSVAVSTGPTACVAGHCAAGGAARS